MVECHYMTSDSGTKELIRSNTQKKTVVQEPPMYRVILLNDHYTSMEFVVLVLESIFMKNLMEATEIMLSVHRSGSGIAGIYTKEVAETKVATVTEVAREHGFPLKCIMEPVRSSSNSK